VGFFHELCTLVASGHVHEGEKALEINGCIFHELCKPTGAEFVKILITELKNHSQEPSQRWLGFFHIAKHAGRWSIACQPKRLQVVAARFKR
jgi:hypothetical protein